MNTKNIVGFSVIMWASSKFLPLGWAITVYCLIAIFGIYCIIRDIKELRERKENNTSEIQSPFDEEPKQSSHELKANIGINIVMILIIVGLVVYPFFKNNNSANSLENEIAQINKEWPVSVTANGQTVTYHSLNFDDDYIIVNIKLDSSDSEYVETIKNLDTNGQENKMAKYGLCYKSEAPYKLLADKYHKGIKAIYFFNEIGDGRTLEIPYDEIISINKTPQNEAYSMELEEYLLSLNRSLPEIITDGFSVTRFFVEGDYVVTEYSFDDKKLDYTNYIADKDGLKLDLDNELLSSANQNDPLFMLNGLTARCGKGRKARIKTIYSNDSIDIVNTPEEVHSIFANYLK